MTYTLLCASCLLILLWRWIYFSPNFLFRYFQRNCPGSPFTFRKQWDYSCKWINAQNKEPPNTISYIPRKLRQLQRKCIHAGTYCLPWRLAHSLMIISCQLLLSYLDFWNNHVFLSLIFAQLSRVICTLSRAYLAYFHGKPINLNVQNAHLNWGPKFGKSSVMLILPSPPKEKNEQDLHSVWPHCKEFLYNNAVLLSSKP
jgi:hypothetical protein